MNKKIAIARDDLAHALENLRELTLRPDCDGVSFALQLETYAKFLADYLWETLPDYHPAPFFMLIAKLDHLVLTGYCEPDYKVDFRGAFRAVGTIHANLKRENREFQAQAFLRFAEVWNSRGYAVRRNIAT